MHLKKPWGITTSESRWTGWFLYFLGAQIDKSPQWLYYQQYKTLINPPLLDGGTLIDLGIIARSLISALLSYDFKLRIPTKKSRLAQGFIGGVFMGYGARLVMGCNIGGFFSAIPQLAFNGWVFFVGLLIGGYIGAKLVVKL
ncbi:MAG: YeeE/YedE thiosulfate transporter family protein [Candidatus Asgardarchaeia archaeon]